MPILPVTFDDTSRRRDDKRQRRDAVTGDNILIPAWVDGVLQPVDKLDVHLRGLRHPAISAFVTRGDHILLQKRADTKYHTPGLWANTCCTHPRWGEGALACAERRLNEELGITGLPLMELGEFEYRAAVGNGLVEHEVATIFTAEAPDDLATAVNTAEVAETAWVTRADLFAALDEAPDRFTPWLRIYMARHHGLIFSTPA
jgi:isopentenyl-diphosphate delta-isomerase